MTANITPIRLITLYGRYDHEETMEDWGFQGPTIENIAAVHYTYGEPVIYFMTRRDKEIAQKLTGWEEWGKDALRIGMHEDALHLQDDKGSSYYGDWEFQVRGGNIRYIQSEGRQRFTSMFDTISSFNDLRTVYAESNRGIYIPQFFAETLDRNLIDWEETDGSQDDILEALDGLLAGPDSEHYWERWGSIEDGLILRVPSALCSEGVYARVYQDEDLFIEFDIYRNWDRNAPTVRSSLVSAYFDHLQCCDPESIQEFATQFLLGEANCADQTVEFICEAFYDS